MPRPPARPGPGPPGPGQGSRRVLLEEPDAGLARRAASELRRAGFRVSVCPGEAAGGRPCPVLHGGVCPLVARSELVVHHLAGSEGQAVLAELRAGRTPVLALGDDAGGDLADRVGRHYAGRARGWRLRLPAGRDRTVEVRAIGPADSELLRRFDGELSEESRRFRYLGWMPPMTAERAGALATVDFSDRFAFVAVADEEGRERVVADCRLIPIGEQPGAAELAIAVADDFQGSGLGHSLVRLMLGVAADRGLRKVVGDVRYDNDRMIHLLRSLGFERTSWDLGVLELTYRVRRPRSGAPVADNGEGDAGRRT